MSAWSPPPFVFGDAVPLCAEVDADLFFPADGEKGTEAKRICRRCELREPCAQFAIDQHITVGIWGGLGREERRKQWRAAA